MQKRLFSLLKRYRAPCLCLAAGLALYLFATVRHPNSPYPGNTKDMRSATAKRNAARRVSSFCSVLSPRCCFS